MMAENTEVWKELQGRVGLGPTWRIQSACVLVGWVGWSDNVGATMFVLLLIVLSI